MTEQIGLVANVGGQYPDKMEFKSLNPAYFRTIVYRIDDVLTALASIPGSTRIIALINNENKGVGSNWAGLELTLNYLCKQLGSRLAAVEIGNELDLLGEPPEFAASLVRRAYPVLKRYGVPCILSSVAGSDWVNWLQRAVSMAANQIDGVALHPYGAAANGYPRPDYLTGELSEKIKAAHFIANKPVWVTEMGVKLGEVGGEQGQAVWVRKAFEVVKGLGPSICPAACLFAFHDANGGPNERDYHAFGLIEDSVTQRRRNAFYTFCDLTKTRPYIEPIKEASVPTPAAPPTFWVGSGVQKFVKDKKLTVVGNELYFTPEASATPTQEGLVFWIKGDGKARLVRWEE